MAFKKKTAESVEETNVDTVENTEQESTELNEDEKEVLSNGVEEVSVANTKKLELVAELLAHQFNIDDSFYLTKVADKGNSITLGFGNKDYEVSIKVKDLAEMGIDSYVV